MTRLEASNDIKTKSPIQGFDFTTTGNGARTVTARAFEKNGSGQQAVALWFGGDPAQQPRYDSTGKEIDIAARPDRVPNENRATKSVTVTFADAKMSNLAWSTSPPAPSTGFRRAPCPGTAVLSPSPACPSATHPS
ncbi:hypothetical protein [Lentzea californiensis]|uniref:hypothetical protein n=1 Tax=Lentzea californiensis TaxID=438851 RepID=UPI002166636B|nr:hypothetical protein [Lentzea californiensis]MCR3753747.1 hypothetical protein [Lentzea californiensis]